MTMTETRIYADELRQGDELADGTVIDSPVHADRTTVVADVVTPDGRRSARRWPLHRRLTVYRRYSGEVW